MTGRAGHAAATKVCAFANDRVRDVFVVYSPVTLEKERRTAAPPPRDVRPKRAPSPMQAIKGNTRQWGGTP
ncbi:MAG: hypothetical protein WDW36_003477 [Sanguina aurantia]